MYNKKKTVYEAEEEEARGKENPFTRHDETNDANQKKMCVHFVHGVAGSYWSILAATGMKSEMKSGNTAL